MSTLEQALAGLELRRDESAWQPRLFDASVAADQAALTQLIEVGAVRFASDTILAQLAELVEVRAPALKRTPRENERAIEEHLASRAAVAYGAWVYYPWVERLIHVLPRDEYVEVRTSRNRNKITAAEQAQLGALTVGIAGLSVGQSTAITLALEGVGGRFRLADFDTINLSNLNRLRAGAHAIGVNKAIVTAREIFELNPYADVTIFPDGVNEANLAAFLDGLDLLFEECDDLKMKIRLREAARARRIAVLMETSDRGLFDVERFDREPDRPIFHGLTGDLRADELEGLTTHEKVPVVLQIIGEHTMSRRMAASLVDIDATIKSWPQLASAVALGGAVNTDAARRIALDQLRGSGRFFIDLAELVSEGAEAPIVRATPPAPTPPVERPPLASLRRVAVLDVAALRLVVEHGALAPSGGNAQPWRFKLRAGGVDCMLDPARRPTLLDFEDSASHLALGAAVENMVLAAGALGFATDVQALPGGSVIARLRLSPSDDAADPLAAHIVARATNRRLGQAITLTPDQRSRLAEAVAPARLELLEAPQQLAEIAALLGEGDRLRFLSKTMHEEMMSELRWSAHDAMSTRDGIDVASLELPGADLAGLRLVSRWPIMETLGAIGGGAGLTKATKKAIAASAAVGLVSLDGDGPRAYFEGGRAVERTWLAATALGLAFQPMTPLVYLFARLARGGVGLSSREVAELTALRARFGELFAGAARTEVMLFRIGSAGAPSVPSLRRALDDIVDPA